MPFTASLPKGPASKMAGGRCRSGPVMAGVGSGAGAGAGGLVGSLLLVRRRAGDAFCAPQTETSPKHIAIMVRILSLSNGILNLNVAACSKYPKVCNG